MTQTLKLTAASTRTSGISSTTVANGATAAGSAIDNATNLDLLLNVEAVYSYGTNPTVSKTIRVHLTYAQDGTNYEDVGPQNQISSISPAADTNAHRLELVRGLSLLPYPFKLHVVNVDTAQTITITLNASTNNVAAS